MPEELVPVFRVTDAAAATEWYRRSGFVLVHEHRFGPGYPRYRILRRGDVHLHLSEHVGDAAPGGLAYFHVDDRALDTLAEEFDVAPAIEPWAREIELVDPDGNRLRIGAASV